MAPGEVSVAEAEASPMPYREGARVYTRAGWVGVLPVPFRSKQIRARGWTGHTGGWPSGADVQAWMDSDARDEGGGNIALRMPWDGLGLDVDAYGDKAGAATLHAAQQHWGPLPPTWRTTSRDDGISGIRLYRVPEGLAWPGQLGPGTELIQSAHRYALVWPSIHPEGRVYRWINPDGLHAAAVPTIEQLPELPAAWVAGLTGGLAAEHHAKADLTITAAQAWLLSAPTGAPCRRMDAGLRRALAALTAGSRHEATRDGALRLVRLAQEHHHGLAVALGELHAAFRVIVADSGRGAVRTDAEATTEWMRILHGAVALVVANPGAAGTTGSDPCEAPFSDLVATPVTPLHTGNVALVPAVVDAPAPEADQQPAAQHSTWWPVDLIPVLAGHNTEPEPTVLRRDDGQALLYAGKINGLLGESESGKSWLAQLAVIQELRAGHDVLYVDCEDTAPGIVNRLRAMGLQDPVIAAHLTYIGPEEALTALASTDLSQTLATRARSLIVLDGVNAAMTLLGLELESNTDATRFAQLLLRPLAATGAAVLTVDHVPKDPDKRGKGGIGAQAKRAMVTGAALSVTVVNPFGRGATGKLRLTVDKDRPGWVRGASVASKYVGVAILCSDGDSAMVTVTIDPASVPEPGKQLSGFRPTTLMSRVSNYLSSVEGGASGNQIEADVEGKREGIRRALEVLVSDGYVTRSAGPRGAVLHHHQRRYSELEDLIAQHESREVGTSDD